MLALQLPAGTALAQPAPDRQPAADTRLAPLLNMDAPDTIPGQYIVVFKPGTTREAVMAAQRTVKTLDGALGFTYSSALTGFSARLSPKAVEALRATPGVTYIEADQKVSINTVQNNPPTGLDRTSERLLPLDNRYTYSEDGTNVHAYIVDTGIRATHTDFGGRVSGGVDEVLDGNGTNDCHGHGTNVAGIVGSATYGIAKNVALHPVRVLGCTGSGATSGVIAGIDWITTNATHPAVANLSLGGGASTAEDTAVNNSINSGVIFVVAAGNNNSDACGFSPARVPAAITVGNIDPSNDTRWTSSNFGPCLDLFAPGRNILATGNASDTATSTFTGTSQASPHVAGVAARYLQNHTAANQAAVLAAIHNAADVATTPGWGGVIGLGTGSPNELLHWGSLNDGTNDGDPHITTVDGVHYDFQGAGEFVSLRDGGNMEIQTRQTPVPTASIIGPNPHTGLTSCVSLNTAVAARVGSHRVSFQPNISGNPDPSGMQLRVDGALTTLGPQGVDLGADGRIVKTAGNSVEIDFADDTVMIATPSWWPGPGKWYLNVDVFHTRASEGIMGAMAPGGWLPALPDGSSTGPQPAALHQRYVDLNQTFADAWRVSRATSLFDYAPDTSTANFTLRSWPPENGPCVIPDQPAAKPLSAHIAQNACRAITDKNLRADCVFDVTVTGERGFARAHLLSQRIRVGRTMTTVRDNLDSTECGEPVTFTARVTSGAERARGVPAGTVQFTIDGRKAGAPVKLNARGEAQWRTPHLRGGGHQVTAQYIPGKGSVFLASSGVDNPRARPEKD